MEYNIQGHVFRLAAPTFGRLKRLENLDKEKLDDIIEAFKLCCEGPHEELDIEELDMRKVSEVLADFLSQVNQTAARQMRQLVGLAESKTETSN